MEIGINIHSWGKNTGVGCHALLQPRDLSNPGIELTSLMPPALAGRFFTTIATWEAPYIRQITNKDLQHGTRNSTQYSEIIYMRKESKKEWTEV